MSFVGFDNNIINIIHNDKKDSIETAEILKKKLIQKGFKITNGYDYTAILNICIGGDGAFLKAVHNYNFPDIPFIGINTGHLGFFQEVSPDKIDNFIDNLVKGKYKIEEIFLVEALICTRTSCIELIGINEIAIKGIESKTIHLDISIDDAYLERLSGDGVIISTPVGSTAYSYSAGGSIVHSSLKTLQITPLAPLNSNVYRALTSSIIVPDNMPIKINPEYRFENSILIVVDGQQHKFDNIVEINFKLSDMTIKMLTLKSKNFWNKIKEKFL
ncbi:NAD+ kinase [Caloranaerobacter azorensis DSM 13643]|uniref:NAD kinase n=1 Tax=Caloranaerobacter azorensis DSM 13643 TaxID=1121264 RepID=A0A1M5SQP1_9FIRM|nr:NAD(+)/NADH kinase [Caloranaerobacter azorensis]SHH40638.1 NAD+ kinase [Caloranaerobacter azorensis DSM 13643]